VWVFWGGFLGSEPWKHAPILIHPHISKLITTKYLCSLQ